MRPPSAGTVTSFNPRFRTVSIIPGIENFAPERTETRSGRAGSPSFLPVLASIAATPSSTCFHRPGGNRPLRLNALHAFVVIVNPGGTGRPRRVISASPAPLPPRRSRIDALPSSNRYTYFGSPLPPPLDSGALYNGFSGRSPQRAKFLEQPRTLDDRDEPVELVEERDLRRHGDGRFVELREEPIDRGPRLPDPVELLQVPEVGGERPERILDGEGVHAARGREDRLAARDVLPAPEEHQALRKAGHQEAHEGPLLRGQDVLDCEDPDGREVEDAGHLRPAVRGCESADFLAELVEPRDRVEGGI